MYTNLDGIFLKTNDFTEDGLNEIEDLLKKAVVGRFTLCNGSKPYIVPLNFLYYERKIFFHCV
jgi:nitroimidazol reductase NimA-like FMN-containing flavoprotein (pyridoxamine 5'-phosphate oxidase superfamily)